MRPLTLIAIGLGIGVVAVAVAPAFAPELRRYVRPAAKQALKAVLATAVSARVHAAELMEDFEDLLAEAQVEVMQERMATHTNGAAKPKARAPRARKPASRKRTTGGASAIVTPAA